MHIAIRHEADLLTLALHQPAFGHLVGLDVAPMAHRRWVRRGGAATGRDMHILHVAFIGKSGYSKSSLINAIVGRDVLETSAIEACTQDAQNASFRIAGDKFLSFADVPGIGESAAGGLGGLLGDHPAQAPHAACRRRWCRRFRGALLVPANSPEVPRFRSLAHAAIAICSALRPQVPLGIGLWENPAGTHMGARPEAVVPLCSKASRNALAASLTD